MTEALIPGVDDVNGKASLPAYVYPPASRVTACTLLSPLAALCIIYQFESRAGESELDVARTLLLNGARIDTSIAIDTGATVAVPLVEYCVRFGSAKWVRFLLSHGAEDTQSGLLLVRWARV